MGPKVLHTDTHYTIVGLLWVNVPEISNLDPILYMHACMLALTADCGVSLTNKNASPPAEP